MRGRSTAHVGALDGIRAVAIALVFVFHAAPDVLHGGYVGVDVFFVLSGYLITSLLADEWRETGAVDLRAFYSRRAVRLYPALLSASVLVVPLAWWLHARGLPGDEVAGLTYTSDFWTLVHTPHVDALGQLWSLAVEEQFYLVWPLVIVVILRRFGDSSWKVVTAAVAPLALVTALVFQVLGWQAAYFPPWGSTDALMVGAALALLVPMTGGHPPYRRPQLVHLVDTTAAGAVGLAVILAGAIGLHEVQDPRAYRGGLLVVALGTAVVIAHVVRTDGSPIGRLLGCAPARWAGRRSYAIYLVHLGALDLLAHVHASRSIRIAGALVLSLILAEASWRLLESPVSHRLRPGIAARARARASTAGPVGTAPPSLR